MSDEYEKICAEDKSLVLGALDTMGCLLADYGHVWTEGERAIYDQAYTILTGKSPNPA